MKAHYNLYYIFLEDMRQHPMPEERNVEIRKNIEIIYRKIKPPWKSSPLNITKKGRPETKQTEYLLL